MSHKNTEETFWNNINISSKDLCWEWIGKAGTNEYAQTRWNNIPILCHRKSYELFYGVDVPDDLEVCHTCDNPPCCNPYHLFLGTHQDNVDDRERKGRNKLPHSLGEEHGKHKLTEEEVLEIIRLYYKVGGHTYHTLAEIFNVSFGNVRKIIKGQTWNWLTGIV